MAVTVDSYARIRSPAFEGLARHGAQSGGLFLRDLLAGTREQGE